MINGLSVLIADDTSTGMWWAIIWHDMAAQPIRRPTSTKCDRPREIHVEGHSKKISKLCAWEGGSSE